MRSADQFVLDLDPGAFLRGLFAFVGLALLGCLMLFAGFPYIGVGMLVLGTMLFGIRADLLIGPGCVRHRMSWFFVPLWSRVVASNPDEIQLLIQRVPPMSRTGERWRLLIQPQRGWPIGLEEYMRESDAEVGRREWRRRIARANEAMKSE